MAVSAQAQSFFAVSDAMGYTGSGTRYSSLADAQSETNQTGSFTFSARDAGLYITHDASSFEPSFPDANIFLTSWYYTTQDNTNGFPKDDPNGDRYYSGFGNPNNTSNSFMQLYDADGNTDSSATGFWTSTAYDTFQLNIIGSNALPGSGGDSARMWDGATAGGVTFVEYALSITATGLNGAFNPISGLVESNVHPATVTGTFTGIFTNATGNFFRFNLTLDGDQTWAELQGDAALNGNFSNSAFGAAPVPEPASVAALGLGALALLRKRIKKS
jgi:hypothetical protein